MPSDQVTSSTYLDAVKHRRTVYGINDKPPIENAPVRIEEIVNEVMLTLPSSFNSQSTRLLVALGDQHKQLWDTVIEAAKAIILQYKGEEDWKRNEQRLQGFRAGYGTIAFFESQIAVKAVQEKMPDFADAFPQFSEHSSAMHQITLWTALELEGFGASLQHQYYIPGVEDAIKKEFDIPSDWSNKALLVFGGMAQEMPGRPVKNSLKDTVKIAK